MNRKFNKTSAEMSSNISHWILGSVNFIANFANFEQSFLILQEIPNRFSIELKTAFAVMKFLQCNAK